MSKTWQTKFILEETLYQRKEESLLERKEKGGGEERTLYLSKLTEPLKEEQVNNHSKCCKLAIHSKISGPYAKKSKDYCPFTSW